MYINTGTCNDGGGIVVWVWGTTKLKQLCIQIQALEMMGEVLLCGCGAQPN